MAFARALLVVLLLSGLAGCSSTPHPATPTETNSSTLSATAPSPSSATTSTSSSPLPELPFGFLFNDCTGLRSAYRFAGDTAPTGSEVPPGWEDSNPTATVHDTIILECGRFSLGQFERGPIHILLESHNRASIPQKCLDYETATNIGEVLRGIWFDDAEIAGFLASNWSMPVHVGIFTFEETTQGGLSIFKWTWGEGGSEPSELDYSRTETSEGGNPDSRRYFWHDGTSVYLMDFAMDDRQPLVTPYSDVGVFREPMMPIDPYVGVFSLADPGASYSGTLHHFRDLQCNES